MTPTLNPCRCRATPAPVETERYGLTLLRIECKCGNHGGTLMWSKPSDAERMRQAAADGWNLAHSLS